METRFVGRTGLQVSELCLGTMTFGADGGTDEATAHQILDAFVDAGGTFIDTANVYSQGVAEEILGRWLKIRNRDDLSQHHGWEPFVSLQPLYNLLDRGAELELLPVCRNEGVGVIAWSPLAGGWLSGKYTRDLDGPPAGARADDEEWAGRNSDRTWRVIETVQAVAAEVDRTPAQVALRWVLQQPGLTGPIIGARTPEQLADNLGATGWALDDDQLRRLTETGDQLLPYPYQLQRLPQFVRRPT